MTSSLLTSIIVADDPDTRNRALEEVCRDLGVAQLLEECSALEQFRRSTPSLYSRVRALFFLYAIHRFHLPRLSGCADRGLIPHAGVEHLFQRRFEESIAVLLEAVRRNGPSESLSSALAAAYRALAFQNLADQVRRSVRSVRGNQWMFRITHPVDQPLRARRELLQRNPNGAFPILRERTPVRMDLSHSAWSDIFFLGMDYPEAARVLNVSIDLAVRGRDSQPQPPIETYFRVIEEPVLRLTSIDLECTAELTEIREVFDFARDYLGLLKAAIIGSGLVPPGTEGSGATLESLLETMAGKGRGFEIVSCVRGIPKGSRLAVSTNLLASLIALCMRATGQTRNLEGPLDEEERRTVASRAILGEWLGGSGGGWQDSAGLWPGMKLIEGCRAGPEDPEHGISRGRLLPRHQRLDERAAPARMRELLERSLVLVHGGMAQNVGPILEMVSEKYLLRSGAEWRARQDTLRVMEELLEALRTCDLKRLGKATTDNFFGPIQTIIPFASNAYTETLIERVRARFGAEFLGFWMLGGMSGGGMGFLFAPEIREQAAEWLQSRMLDLKRELKDALPFAIDPVVYDFAINDTGTRADWLAGPAALMPPDYYPLWVPRLLRSPAGGWSELRRAEIARFAEACRADEQMRTAVPALFDRLLPSRAATAEGSTSLEESLGRYGFDRRLHEQIRGDLRAGRLGLAQNRLPASIQIEDARPEDFIDARETSARQREIGAEALARGEVAVVTLAGGAASRWTQGALVVKALHPFFKFDGRHRSFLEVHLAKTRLSGRTAGRPLLHTFTTSYVTHEPIRAALEGLRVGARTKDHEPIAFVSEGRNVGLRLVPMVRDLRFQWEETAHALLDERAQKVRDSLHEALIGWARRTGEGSDYLDNVPLQCLHPVGHWFEVPNLLKSGTLRAMLEKAPSLRTLLLSNVDTLGAHLDAGLLGLHRELGATLSFEVIPRTIDDHGGGLARVQGRPRLVEGLAFPCESDERKLTLYNSMTTWIEIDPLLGFFGLERQDLLHPVFVEAAIRERANRLPTYITLKDVKRRWGHGQEDVFPVAQFEKLWSDMTGLAEVSCRFLLVPRRRGQQLKEPGQLDAWSRDGSSRAVSDLCEF